MEICERLVARTIDIEHAHGQPGFRQSHRKPSVFPGLEECYERAKPYQPLTPGSGEYGEMQRDIPLFVFDIEFPGIFRAVVFPDVDADMALYL